MEPAVEQAVTAMWDRYDEQLSVPVLAAESFFSPFHFSRIFRRETGVTPCQFLTAVRLYEAKRLLLTTSINVADIACMVGYPGIGTFTTRFGRWVGMSPRQYRRLPPGRVLSITDSAGHLPSAELVAVDEPRQFPGSQYGGTVQVSVHSGSETRPGRGFAGVFDDLVPQGPPVAWVPLRLGEPCRIGGLPAGLWVVIAVAEGQPVGHLGRSDPLLAGVAGPVAVTSGVTTSVEIGLRRPQRTDPPIMVPLSERRPAPRLMAA